MFYYTIRFEAEPKEMMFELRQKKPVPVRDVIRAMNANFKNTNFEVTLNSKALERREKVKYGITYIVKCIHLPTVRKKKKKRTYYV